VPQWHYFQQILKNAIFQKIKKSLKIPARYGKSDANFKIHYGKGFIFTKMPILKSLKIPASNGKT